MQQRDEAKRNTMKMAKARARLIRLKENEKKQHLLEIERLEQQLDEKQEELKRRQQVLEKIN